MSKAEKCCSCNKVLRNRCGTYCYECTDARNLKRTKRWAADRPLAVRAVSAVHKAIKEGRLKPAVLLSCLDCGKPAECYDHRDYRKPLQVDPVCRSCNMLRGPGSPYKRLGKIAHNLPPLYGITRQRVQQLESK